MRPLSVLWIALLLFSFNALSAQTTWTGTTNSDWFIATNWSSGLPSNANQPATIPAAPTSGNFPDITAATTIDYQVDVFGGLDISSAVTLQSALFRVFATSGQVEVNSGATLLIDAASTIQNTDIIRINGDLINNGTYNNSGGGLTEILGSGVFTNNANVTNNDRFDNQNLLLNNGAFTNALSFTNQSDGEVINNGTFDNSSAGSVFNNGTATTAGTITNNADFFVSGLLSNATNGLINNFSSFNVRSNGTVENDGDINNYSNFSLAGILDNASDFNNWGTLLNNFGSNFNNTGVLINFPCAFINHFTSNALVTGTVANNGILYEIGSDVAVDSGDGVVFTNFASFPAPTAQCSTTVSVVLSLTTSTAIITPADIDSMSVAPYCGIETYSLSRSSFDCTDVGVHSIVLTVTDTLGASSQCSSTVTVVDGQAPTFVSCPTSQTFNLLAATCTQVVNYSVPVATDNCAMPPSVTQITSVGLTSGSAFPVGINTVTFVASDGSLTDTCSFTLTINDFQPFSNTLVCNQNGQLSVDLDCESDLHASMLLIGEYGCWDRYETTIKETGETTINIGHLGQYVNIMVTDTITGNACWGTVFIEDKGGPAILNCLNDTIYCIESPLPVSEGGDIMDPMFQDCQDISLHFYDNVDHFDCASTFTKVINRNWIATDVMGNTSSCIQEISIRSVDWSAATTNCPADYDEECVVGANQSLHPDVTGYPSIEIGGTTFELNDDINLICNIKATFRDDTLATSCGASINIIRTWKVLDCCASNTILWTCSQSVKLTDTTKPNIVINPLFEAGIDNDYACTAKPILPPAIISDCSPYDVLIMTPSGVIRGNGGQVPAPGLNQGVNIVTYLVTDECGNSSTAEVTVNIIDTRPPTPVCKTFTTISLTTGGIALINADSLNAGSHDECCLDPATAFKVRRFDDACMAPMDTTFQDYITVCCADALDTLEVELQVTDCAGNSNTCNINLLIDNKLPPTITCPSDITIRCDQDFNNLSLTGNVVSTPATPRAKDGFAEDNCGAVTVEFEDDVNLACGSGLVLRTWAAIDMTGNRSICVQKITTFNPSPFDGDRDIVWPNDTIISTCNIFPDTSITGVPNFVADICDAVEVSFRDDTIRTISGDAIRIMRIWTVADLCQFVLNDPSQQGVWRDTQIIEISDPIDPVIADCNNKLFCNENLRCQPLRVDLSITATDNCTDDSQLTILWEVDLNADGIAETGAEFSGSGMNTTNRYPNGNHEICYTVIDGFNNQTSCCFLFKIIDCKKPTAVCQGNSIAIMPTGMVPANINLFHNNSSSDNCTAEEDLLYSYSSDVNDTVRIFNCLNVGNSTTVELWVTDEAGNQQSCNTFVDVQDPDGVCTSTTKAAISGAVKDNKDQGVSNVQMTISGQGTATIPSDNQGQFQFSNIPTGYDYSLTPVKNDDLRNGISTLDIVMLSKHVLNVSLLDSPYKMIAADINRSGSISTLDIVALRKVVLHVADEFPRNTSWRFVDKDHIFPNPKKPFETAIPEVINYNNLSYDDLRADFVAVKVGDLSGDAQPNDILGVDDRTFNEYVNLTIHNQTFKKGEIITVPISVGENESLAGLQSTINFNTNAMQLVAVGDGGLISRENLGLTLLNDGAITLSWDNANSQTLIHGQTLFSLQFQTLAAGKLSEWLSLSSSHTTAEAYDFDGSLYNLNLVYHDDASSNNTFELYQNKPNPFANQTFVGFNLPAAAQVTLTVFDLSGKIIRQYEDDFANGYNEFKLDQRELNASGVLYYRLDTPTNSATRKMILMKDSK